MNINFLKRESEKDLESRLRRRVRLFSLNADGRTWSDRGIGEISVYRMDASAETYLLIHAELDGALLLENKIEQYTAYRKQQERFIIWADKVEVFGVSFQQNEGCIDIWRTICQVQGRDPYLQAPPRIMVKRENVKTENETETAQSAADDEQAQQPDERTKESWLEQLLDIENIVVSRHERSVLEQMIESVNRLVAPLPEDTRPTPAESRLLDLFHANGSREETRSLQQLRETVLYLLSLKNNRQ